MQQACTQFFDSGHVCTAGQSFKAQISCGFWRYRINLEAIAPLTVKLINIRAGLPTITLRNSFRETPLPSTYSYLYSHRAGIKFQNKRAFLDAECIIIFSVKVLYQAAEANCVAQCSFVLLIREKCLKVGG